jgi:hypothetical protein
MLGENGRRRRGANHAMRLTSTSVIPTHTVGSPFTHFSCLVNDCYVIIKEELNVHEEA